MKNNHRQIGIISLAAIIILGCSSSVLGLTTEEPSNSAQTETPGLSFLPATVIPTESSQQVPTETALVPVEAPPDDPICVTRSENAPAPTFSHYANLPNELLLAINNGVTANDLQSALALQGFSKESNAIRQADLTGDGKYELMISIINPDSQTINPSGSYIIFNCNSGVYRPGFVQQTGGDSSVLETKLVRDLNADGSQEVIISSAACGAHTCFEDYRLLVWTGRIYDNRLVGDTTDLPFPEVQVVDYDENGYYDVEITGTGIASVGAGPQRSFTRRWSNNTTTQSWEVVEEYQGQSNYRIHLLHDADKNFRSENYDVARALYMDAILNDNLEDWMDPPRERALITAYAEYKIFVVYLINNNIAEAESYYQDLSQKYANETTGTLFGATKVLFDTYQSSGLEAACTSARNFVEQNRDALIAPLGEATFGYGNPEITIDDLCP